MSWALLQKGAVTATVSAAMRVRPSAFRADPRRLANRMELQAAGLDREAAFADADGKKGKARECREHAARLRKEASEINSASYPQ